MNETLRERPRGLTASGLRLWGMLCVCAGMAGRGLLQNAMLGLNGLNSAQLLKLLETDPDAMSMVTVALVLEVIFTCAAPIFAFLLVEGFTHTGDFVKYLLRVAGVAVIAEIPYNLAISGKLLAMDSRNPAFALAVCLVVLYFYNRYSEKSFNNFFIKGFVTLAALIWMGMLQIDEGSPLLLLTAVIWAVRNKPNFKAIIGCTAGFACTIFSLYYLACPFSFLALHFYNGEKGEQNRAVNYLSYPAILVAVWLVGAYLI